MTRKKVICILSDALRHDYIDRYKMDFLKNLSEHEYSTIYKEVIPSTGFCEIIEYVTGKTAKETGYLNQITLAKEVSNQSKKLPNFKYLEIAENLIYKLPKIRTYYNKYLRSKVDEYLANYLPEEIVRVRYKIPITSLYKYRPTESLYKYDSESFGGSENLFNILKSNGISYDIDDFVEHNKIKGLDEERLNRLISKIENRNLKDFTLLYIGYGELAHVFGTNSPKLEETFNDYDSKLKEIYDVLKEKYNDFELMILGDHGMIDVDEYIDIDSFMRKIQKEYDANIDYFIDSTMIRVFVDNDSVEENMRERIKSFLNNKFEDDLEVEEYFSNFKQEYGDIIILLKPGIVFYPDFFSNIKMKGMHGYLNTAYGQQGVMLSVGSEKKKNNSVNRIGLEEVKKEILAKFEL